MSGHRTPECFHLAGIMHVENRCLGNDNERRVYKEGLKWVTGVIDGIVPPMDIQARKA